MSQLTDTKQAYDKLAVLLDQEVRKRSGSTADLERCRAALDVAFYLLGWAQFEYLVRKEAEDIISQKVRAQTVERHAWSYLRDNIKNFTVRRRLDLIFHANPSVRESLDRDYDLRNEAAHNYKKLPSEARDISDWLDRLEELIKNF